MKQNRFEISLCFPANVYGSRYGIHDNVKHERVATILPDSISCARVLKWLEQLNSLTDENKINEAIETINNELEQMNLLDEQIQTPEVQ